MGFVSDNLAAVLSLARTAGASVSPAYTDIEIAAPVPRGRCVRVWWVGPIVPAPQLDGERYTLSSEMVGHAFGVTVFEPIGDMAEQPMAARMGTMGDFTDALWAGIDADRTLGGKCMSAEPQASPADYANIGGSLLAFHTTEVHAGFVEHTIGGGS